jgi:hypothetical protein
MTKCTVIKFGKEVEITDPAAVEEIMRLRRELRRSKDATQRLRDEADAKAGRWK